VVASNPEGTTPPEPPVGDPYGTSLPVLPLRDLVFFPSIVLPLLVGRPGSVRALDQAASTDNRLLLVAQVDPEIEDPAGDDLHPVGTLTRIVQRTSLPDGTERVVFEGLERAAIAEFVSDDDTFQVRAHPLPYVDAASGGAPPELEALIRKVERSLREYVHLHPDLADDHETTLASGDEPVRTLHRIAGHTLLRSAEKQKILEAQSLQETATLLVDLLEREVEILRIEEKLDREMRQQIDQERRHIYLQEQMRAIRKELGDDDPEWGDLESRIAEAGLPDAVRERAEREFRRLQKLNPVSPESGVIRSYLDWILALPWRERTTDNADVGHAREVLEEAHYGLDEVKDRILDHIAVLSLVGELKGPVLCLVGPPGVGKTSLGRSIARALGRRFVRVSLGGVRDEAEIRGHRRTYVGSLPGRIVQGLRQAGSVNPVFLLDEVDKLARDGHGDPAAALLEVLDPEQNAGFRDHYLELEVDLSQVLFIATANTLAGIPEALQDRMEVIRIPGYLDTEKSVIAREFLFPDQLRRHGLPPGATGLGPDALARIIEDYTREAGVRELDRCLARVARKLARDVADGKRERNREGVLEPDVLRELLGPPRHRRDGGSDGADRVGMATGLAWTPAGGETLEVEVAVVPGSGNIQLTGTLGDVMKESAVAAFTFARSRARLLGLRPQFHREVDIHIHIPEGATPKDGPSAGVTIAAALVSALTGLPTRPAVAMTGEITLRGRVLPVGGIREKAVAALRTGMTTVVLPAGNEGELELLPPAVRDRLEFRLVEGMDEVMEAVFGDRTALPGMTQGGNREVPGDPLDGGLHLSQ
jgi:ATP-dependent Lon protease